MATPLPARLKGELGRFAVRAQQLEKYRPIATYWCTPARSSPHSTIDTVAKKTV